MTFAVVLFFLCLYYYPVNFFFKYIIPVFLLYLSYKYNSPTNICSLHRLICLRFARAKNYSTCKNKELLQTLVLHVGSRVYVGYLSDCYSWFCVLQKVHCSQGPQRRTLSFDRIYNYIYDISLLQVGKFWLKFWKNQHLNLKIITGSQMWDRRKAPAWRCTAIIHLLPNF